MPHPIDDRGFTFCSSFLLCFCCGLCSSRALQEGPPFHHPARRSPHQHDILACKRFCARDETTGLVCWLLPPASHSVLIAILLVLGRGGEGVKIKSEFNWLKDSNRTYKISHVSLVKQVQLNTPPTWVLGVSYSFVLSLQFQESLTHYGACMTQAYSR